MNADRQLQIAKASILKIIKRKRLCELEETNDILSEYGNLAKEAGIPKEEVLEFGKKITIKALRDVEEKIKEMQFKK